MKNLPKKPRLLSVSKAAKRLHVSINTLRLWDEKGILQPLRTPGGQRRYTVVQIDSFRKTRTHKIQPQKPTNPSSHITSIPQTFLSKITSPLEAAVLKGTDGLLDLFIALSDTLSLHAKQSRRDLVSTRNNLQKGYLTLNSTISYYHLSTFTRLSQRIKAGEKAIQAFFEVTISLILWPVNLLLDVFVAITQGISSALLLSFYMAFHTIHLLYIIFVVAIFSLSRPNNLLLDKP